MGFVGRSGQKMHRQIAEAANFLVKVGKHRPRQYFVPGSAQPQHNPLFTKGRIFAPDFFPQGFRRMKGAQAHFCATIVRPPQIHHRLAVMDPGGGSNRQVVKGGAVFGVKPHQLPGPQQAAEQGLGKGEIIRIIAGEYQVEFFPPQAANQPPQTPRPPQQPVLVIRPDPGDQPFRATAFQKPGHRMMNQVVKFYRRQSFANGAQQGQQQYPVADSLVQSKNQHLCDPLPGQRCGVATAQNHQQKPFQQLFAVFFQAFQG